MTVTISRLYDNYGEARRAVRDLEAAGVKHGDISIIASNAEVGTTRTRAILTRTVTWMGRMIERKRLVLAQGSAPSQAAQSGLLPG